MYTGSLSKTKKTQVSQSVATVLQSTDQHSVSFNCRLESGLYISDLPLAVVENKTGGSELRGLTLLPALETVQPTLPRPKQAFLQTVQTLHQRRHVLVVGILGRVHCPSEPTNECLEKRQYEELETH